MCNPAFIAPALSLVGTMMTANAQQQSGDFDNSVAQFNAREQENQATKLRNRGVEEEIAQRNKTAQLVARQRAQSAAAGVDVNVGSAADLQQDTLVLGEADALRIRRNAEEEADTIERQSKLTLSEGKAAQAAGSNNAFGTLIGGAASVADKWYTPKSSGVLDFT